MAHLAAQARHALNGLRRGGTRWAARHANSSGCWCALPLSAPKVGFPACSTRDRRARLWTAASRNLQQCCRIMAVAAVRVCGPPRARSSTPRVCVRVYTWMSTSSRAKKKRRHTLKTRDVDEEGQKARIPSKRKQIQAVVRLATRTSDGSRHGDGRRDHAALAAPSERHSLPKTGPNQGRRWLVPTHPSPPSLGCVTR